MIINWDSVNKKQTKVVESLFQQLEDKIIAGKWIHGIHFVYTETEMSEMTTAMESKIKEYLASGLDKNEH
jgi:hypothetical protein